MGMLILRLHFVNYSWAEKKCLVLKVGPKPEKMGTILDRSLKLNHEQP